MRKNHQAYANETTTMAAFLATNASALVGALQALAVDVGVTLKTDPAVLVTDLVALANAVVTATTKTSADHEAEALERNAGSGTFEDILGEAHAEGARARSMVRNAHGTAAAQAVFGRGPTPDKPLELITFLLSAARQLASSNVALPSVSKIAAVDRVALQASVASVAAALQAAVTARSTQASEVKGALVHVNERGQTLRNVRNGFRKVAEGLFTMVGDHDRAAHVAEHRHGSTDSAPEAPVVPVSPAAPVDTPKLAWSALRPPLLPKPSPRAHPREGAPAQRSHVVVGLGVLTASERNR